MFTCGFPLNHELHYDYDRKYDGNRYFEDNIFGIFRMSGVTGTLKGYS
jgi:hypothetical protein